MVIPFSSLDTHPTDGERRGGRSPERWRRRWSGAGGGHPGRRLPPAESFRALFARNSPRTKSSQRTRHYLITLSPGHPGAMVDEGKKTRGRRRSQSAPTPPTQSPNLSVRKSIVQRVEGRLRRELRLTVSDPFRSFRLGTKWKKWRDSEGGSSYRTSCRVAGLHG